MNDIYYVELTCGWSIVSAAAVQLTIFHLICFFVEEQYMSGDGNTSLSIHAHIVYNTFATHIAIHLTIHNTSYTDIIYFTTHLVVTFLFLF